MGVVIVFLFPTLALLVSYVKVNPAFDGATENMVTALSGIALVVFVLFNLIWGS